MEDLIYDYLVESENMTDIEEITNYNEQDGIISCNINCLGFNRIEGYQILLSDLLVFVYSKLKSNL